MKFAVLVAVVTLIFWPAGVVLILMWGINTLIAIDKWRGKD